MTMNKQRTMDELREEMAAVFAEALERKKTSPTRKTPAPNVIHFNSKPRETRLPEKLSETLGEARAALLLIKSLTWAAKSLLRHNPDRTTTPEELANHAADLVELIEAKATALGDALSRAERELSGQARR
jgi:hypothetical protein